MHDIPSRRRVEVRRVDACDTLDELIRHCFPAFGGAFLRRIYTILDHAIGTGCPLTLAVAGPVTVSGQHQAWLIPLLETGWIAYLSTTDAVCYHDGHRSLDAHKDPIHEVPISGDDGALRDEKTIRVTDMAFDEDVLMDQDRFLTAVLARPEFQRKMTGTELRYRLGAVYAEQERRNGVAADLHAEVFESCAYHRWGLFDNPVHALATVILGGGVPKNYNLQPEPALGQILGMADVRGYNYDVQIVTAPVTDGSLSSCPPAEAVTWGKVDKDTYQQSTESMQADYSTVMPFLVKALLDNRERYAAMAKNIGEEELFRQEPKARGYLRPREGYRLFSVRDSLCQRLMEDVRNNKEWLLESLRYPISASTADPLVRGRAPGRP